MHVILHDVKGRFVRWHLGTEAACITSSQLWSVCTITQWVQKGFCLFAQSVLDELLVSVPSYSKAYFRRCKWHRMSLWVSSFSASVSLTWFTLNVSFLHSTVEACVVIYLSGSSVCSGLKSGTRLQPCHFVYMEIWQRMLNMWFRKR